MPARQSKLPEPGGADNLGVVRSGPVYPTRRAIADFLLTPTVGRVSTTGLNGGNDESAGLRVLGTPARLGSLMDAIEVIALLCLIPVIGGSVYAILSAGAVLWFFRRDGKNTRQGSDYQPPVTILKPVCGLERDLKARLRSACLQDYPDYQVVYSVQSPNDPALPILQEIGREFGPSRATVVVDDIQVGPNGKVNNLLGALAEARHDVLVISDSDVMLRPDYLSAIVAPLADPETGAVCTPFKATGARHWFEKLEILSVNADFMPSVIFADVTHASKFCLGPSIALRRATLEEMGGLEALAEYLAEDYELGRRVWSSGQRMAFVPHVVETELDIESWSKWWTHQLYWDQNTRVARPYGFFATVLTRSVPFALLYAIATGGGALGLGVLAASVALRLASAGVILHSGFRDREGLRSLWLLPLRDLVGLVSWAMAFFRQTVVWRGVRFRLTSGGRMVAIGAEPKTDVQAAE